MISGQSRLDRSFNLCYRYIDDWIVFNYKTFGDYVKEIYPSQLRKANESYDLANYLDLTFIIDSNNGCFIKHDDFNFRVVNFPFLSTKIPSGPSYGLFFLQLIRYMHDAAHITMTLDIVISFWLTDFCFRVIKSKT